LKQLFDYGAFFRQQIEKKKRDNSYRVFKRILRSKDQFPSAVETSHGSHNITIWCSNDYMELSMHPKVLEAIR
ncbi:unnamed protein product, partial [Lymnaea stagnalis]